MNVPSDVLERMRRVVAGLATSTGRTALRHGVAPLLAPRASLREIGPDVVVDIGANRGQFVLDVRSVAPEAPIVAFEPLDTEADVFDSIHGGDARVHLVRLALSDRAGEAEFYVNRRPDSSSLHRPGPLQTEVFPGTSNRSVRRVTTARLDDVVLPVEIGPRSLVKIDVQGHEASVMRGGSATIARAGWLLVEVSFVPLYDGHGLADEVLAVAEELGFALHGLLHPVVRRDRVIQVDALLRRKF